MERDHRDEGFYRLRQRAEFLVALGASLDTAGILHEWRGEAALLAQGVWFDEAGDLRTSRLPRLEIAVQLPGDDQQDALRGILASLRDDRSLVDYHVEAGPMPWYCVLPGGDVLFLEQDDALLTRIAEARTQVVRPPFADLPVRATSVRELLFWIGSLDIASAYGDELECFAEPLVRVAQRRAITEARLACWVLVQS